LKKKKKRKEKKKLNKRIEIEYSLSNWNYLIERKNERKKGFYSRGKCNFFSVSAMTKFLFFDFLIF